MGTTCVLCCPAWQHHAYLQRIWVSLLALFGQEQNLLGQQGHHASSSGWKFVLSDLAEM